MPSIPRFDVTTKICGAPHVVVLGAGASLAAFPDGDANGQKLPLMSNLVEVVGLCDLIPPGCLTENFEKTFENIANEASLKNVALEIESRIYCYFAALKLPRSPTIYDYLVLSLRDKDTIATFNWDPFLAQAYFRNVDATKGRLPKILFLHGSVAAGQCVEHRQKGFLLEGQKWKCPSCGLDLSPTPLFYPISEKNYSSDPFIANEWVELRDALDAAYLLTIFGYSAPQSDLEAKKLMQSAWRDNQTTDFALVNIVDIANSDDVSKRWRGIDCYRGATVSDQIWNTYLFRHPRRSCDATFMAMMQQCPVAERPFRSRTTLEELQNDIAPQLLEEETGKFWD